jgi:hypothetical protein
LILFHSDICVDFLGTHMIILVLFFRKPGVTITLFLILYHSDICVDFLGTHMISLILFFRKSGVTEICNALESKRLRSTLHAE